MGRIKEIYYDRNPTATEMKNALAGEGCFIMRNLYTPEEIKAMRTLIASSKDDINKKAWTMGDQVTQIVIWNKPGDDVFGRLSRSNKIFDIVETLLDGEAYLYYSALVAKRPPKKIGSPPWHQDYGCWRRYGCPRPDMITCIGAVDTVNEEVGGKIRIAVNSPNLGLLRHKCTDGRFMVDLDHMEEMKDKMPIESISLNAGDVLVRNCNLLHYSEPCEKEGTYWEFNLTYNKRTNAPTKQHHHPGYYHVHRVSATDIVKGEELRKLAGEDFITPDCDPDLRYELTSAGYH